MLRIPLTLTLAAALGFGCLASLALPGCATVASLLPVVVSSVTRSQLVLSTIENVADRWFQTNPDAERRKQIDLALARTRSALEAILKTANGVEKVNQANVGPGFADFARAYEELLVLTRPFGVIEDRGGRFAAAPGGVVLVPPSGDLVPRLEQS